MLEIDSLADPAPINLLRSAIAKRSAWHRPKYWLGKGCNDWLTTESKDAVL